ncbi:MAG: hypothetical protein MUF43_09815 [Flavobacterium sp.]|nr:hypothetical protein [Flavobacterium sp.]
MELKDILIIGLGLLGWTWGIVQFFINRRNQKRDKALEKRFEIYTAFMKKADEVTQKLRTDPNAIYGISTEFMQKMLTGDEKIVNDALLDFNSQLLKFTKNATQPLKILTSEINNLRLVCSDKLLPKIDRYRDLSYDYINEFQLVLGSLTKSNDLNDTIKKLETIGHDQRGIEMGQVYMEIQKMMRDEIGYYKRYSQGRTHNSMFLQWCRDELV